ncbi:hypothetical protein WJX77_004942 [Trebouxia sp. C0004]
MAEGASIVKTVCTAVLGRFQTAPYTIPNFTGRVFAKKRKLRETTESDVYAPKHMSGVTLADLIPEYMEVGFKEEDQMQPGLINLIKAAMGAVHPAGESGMDAILKLDNSPNEGDLLSRDALTLFCQVLCDVAGGIANAANRDIAHRDITPNNFGQLEGRGYLFNFSAAKALCYAMV